MLFVCRPYIFFSYVHDDGLSAHEQVYAAQRFGKKWWSKRSDLRFRQFPIPTLRPHLEVPSNSYSFTKHDSVEICTITLLGSKYAHSLLVCLRTGPQPLPKWDPQRVQSWASSFTFPYPVLSCSCLRLLSRLPNRSILPSRKCFRRQFACKIWTFQ
jgi:energy-converting hydrogenase Eha subunit A